MSGNRRWIQGCRVAIVAIASGVLLNACTVAGPKAIENGRLAYNVALTDTNNQQTLMAVIQNRYDEVSNLLSVHQAFLPDHGLIVVGRYR
jgi:hypothetical protein